MGFRYYENEDCGIFWSNDPQKSIGQMVKELGITPEKEYYQRVRQTYEDLKLKEK